jgi:hypothetical protein
MSDNENELSAEEVEGLFNTATAKVSTLPDEGVAEYEVTEIKNFAPNPKYDGDDLYQVFRINMRNCDNPDANDAHIKVKVYCDKNAETNDWERDENGMPKLRGAGDKKNPLTHADPGTAYGKLLAAIWPRESDRLDKTFRDLPGERVKLGIAYDTFNNNEYAKVNPRPL